jgi:hypothetical protein
MSNYVVIARFDNEMNNKLENLRNTLVEDGCSIVTETGAASKWPPHITIAAYENIDESKICDWAAEFAKSHNKINLVLFSVGILPPGGEHTETAVMCLEPAHSKKFVDFYYDFHTKYEEYCTGIGWFNSISHGNPVIHSTIGVIKVKEMQKALELIFKSGVFGKVEIIALEVYTYPMKLIQRYELK